jgi:hypothetical protein
MVTSLPQEGHLSCIPASESGEVISSPHPGGSGAGDVLNKGGTDTVVAIPAAAGPLPGVTGAADLSGNKPLTREAGTQLAKPSRQIRSVGWSCPACAMCLSRSESTGPCFWPSFIQYHSVMVRPFRKHVAFDGSSAVSTWLTPAEALVTAIPKKGEPPATTPEEGLPQPRTRIHRRTPERESASGRFALMKHGSFLPGQPLGQTKFKLFVTNIMLCLDHGDVKNIFPAADMQSRHPDLVIWLPMTVRDRAQFWSAAAETPLWIGWRTCAIQSGVGAPLR